MKHQVVKVELDRAEGPCDECVKVEFAGADAMMKAQTQMIRWSHTAPKDGGYDKCDFTVTFDDGQTYKGRYDLVHSGRNDGGETIAEQVRNYIGFLAGELRPSWMDDSQWLRACQRHEADGMATEARKFLEAYEV
jgi:hypothetical protein